MFRDTKLPKKKEMTSVPISSDYPYLNLPLKFIPEAEKWPMDKEHEITLRVKVLSVTINKNREQKEEGDGSVSFDITGIKVDDGTDTTEKEKEEKSEGSYKDRSEE